MRAAMILILVLFLIISGSPAAMAQMPRLFSMQTAETLGKGGYATHIGLYRFEKSVEAPKQAVDIGNFFQESHDVRLEADRMLIPMTLTFGVGESLDLSLGATVTTGTMEKAIVDYYEVGETTRARVYSQPMFDGRIGLKYNLKPEMGDGLPSISIGGEFQSGYTADDVLSPAGDFLDSTPVDGFSFAAAQIYMAASMKVGPLVTAHANLGGYLSSKRFRFSGQFGADFLMMERLHAAASYSTVRLVSGSELNSIFDFGMRYEVGDNRYFYVALSTLDFTDVGLMFGFTLGGEKVPVASPTAAPPSNVEELF